MKIRLVFKQMIFWLVASVLVLIFADPTFAHCDGLDGPVVQAAQQALETKNVNLVLIWVAKDDEAEISEAFQKTVATRSLNRQAKELADMYFFETLVHTSGRRRGTLHRSQTSRARSRAGNSGGR